MTSTTKVLFRGGIKSNLTSGVATDINGNFSLKVNENDVLLFSFIGMKPLEVAVKGKTNLMIELETSAETLEEVMVVAYGTTKKESFTGSAAVVKGEELAKKNGSEFTKSLAGEVVGVQVVNSSGQPGTNATIRIWGFGSMNASTAPLYVVDGVPFEGDLSSIDPSDIESSTVLKDAAATALYGARGANGVILVTTKKGKGGEAAVEVEAKYGVNMRLLPLYETISSP